MADLTGRQQAIRHLQPLLAELGFRKRAGAIFTVELLPDVIGVLSLNTATEGYPAGTAEVNPLVGVHHQTIERLVAELEGYKFHPYHPSTVWTPLGYVMPEQRYQAWIFNAERGATAARDLANAVAASGLPFMHRTAELPELIRLLEEGRMGWPHVLRYRRPVAWLVAGDKARAREALEAELVALEGRTDGAAEEFRRFALSLDERLRARNVC